MEDFILIMEETNTTTVIQPVTQNNQKDNSGKAIAGFVLGLAGIFFAWTIAVPVLGLIFSLKGADSKRCGFAKTGKIFSIINLVLGPIELICMIVGIISAVAIYKNRDVIQDSIQNGIEEYNGDMNEIQKGLNDLEKIENYFNTPDGNDYSDNSDNSDNIESDDSDDINLDDYIDQSDVDDMVDDIFSKSSLTPEYSEV